MSMLDDHRREHRRKQAQEMASRNGRLPHPPKQQPLAPETIPESPPPIVNESENDPHRLARLFTIAHQKDGVCTLVRWQDEFHRWDGSAYRVVSDEQVQGEVVACIKREFDHLNLLAQATWEKGDKKEDCPTVTQVTRALVANVTQALGSITLLDSRIRQPSWREEDPPCQPETILACRNGLLDLGAFFEGVTRLLPPTPRFFSGNALDYDYDPNAPEPKHWLKFLSELWPNDTQSIDTVQEWLGLNLTPDTSQHKILLLVGPKRGGKGTIATVLEWMVGSENVAAPTLSSLGTDFGLQPLIGKTVAIVGDAKLSGKVDVITVTERLLSISGGDLQTVNRKYQSSLTSLLPVRFTLCANELPKFTDAAGAIASRMIVLKLVNSWYGKEDMTLKDKLKAEIPGILLWALEGWKRLMEGGHFVQPDSGKPMVEQLEELTSNIGQYVKECCDVGPYQATPEELYDKWRTWCSIQGIDRPGTKQTFCRDLVAALPEIKLRNLRIDDEKRQRVYEGIRPRPKPVPQT